MKKVTRTEVDFSEIFEFAEKDHGIKWNAANDLFFRNEVLRYQRHDDLTLEDIEWELCEEGFAAEGDVKKAFEILLDFMKKKNLKEMRVFNG